MKAFSAENQQRISSIKVCTTARVKEKKNRVEGQGKKNANNELLHRRREKKIHLETE